MRSHKIACGALLAAALAPVGGCSSNPCDGVNGICLNARVEGSATLDQLRLTLDSAPGNAQLSPMPAGASFTLPVRLAVTFAQSEAGSTALTIEGLRGGSVVATTGKVPITIPTSGAFSQTFTMIGGSLGDGGGDGPGGRDGSSGGLVIAPSTTITFPDTARGMSSNASFSVTNNTSMTLTSNTTPTGDLNSFSVAVDPSTPTCQVGQTTSIGPGVTCKYIATFSPKVTGSTSQTDALSISDGEMLTVTFTGKGLPGWAKETLAISGGIQAAYAASATDLYVVGKDSANMGQGVWYSAGDGNWRACVSVGASLNNVFSVAGDGNTVYVGTDGGMIWYTPAKGACNWKTAATGNSGWTATAAVVGLGVDVATQNVWAVSGSGVVAVSPISGNNFINQVGMSTPPPLINRLAVPAQNQPIWVGAQGSTGFVQGISAAGGPVGYPTTAAMQTLRGVWGGAGGFWVAGDGGTIARYVFDTTMPPKPETLPNGISGAIYSLSGRTDANGNVVELYAAGLLGNVVLQSTGNGVWSAVTLPDNTGSIAVSEAPTGEVIVGQLGMPGNPAVVCHYY